MTSFCIYKEEKGLKQTVENVKKDILGTGVQPQLRGWLYKNTDWLSSIISPMLVFSHGVHWTGARRGISLVVLLGREGLWGHRCITHRHTALKTNRAWSSISARGERDHFRLGPHRGERGRINAERDGWWRPDGMKQKLHLVSRVKTASICEKAPEVKQMSDLTGPETMIK